MLPQAGYILTYKPTSIMTHSPSLGLIQESRAGEPMNRRNMSNQGIVKIKKRWIIQIYHGKENKTKLGKS